MPDTRQHRGRHPADDELFAPDQIPILREAVNDLSWLLTRGYSDNAALKLVGDRYSLRARQRNAVMRSACSDQSLARRLSTQLAPEVVAGQPLAIDGYNLLITIESALGGGILLIGRDGCLRDLASLHGTYKSVEETLPALQRIGRALQDLQPAAVTWYLDAPVSNSGRLAAAIRALAESNAYPWTVELRTDVDPALAATDAIVLSSDSWVLDRAVRWIKLAQLWESDQEMQNVAEFDWCLR